MKEKLFGGAVGSSVSLLGLSVSAEQLDHIVSIICSVSGVLIVIISTFLIPLIKKYKQAKADGVITEEEKKDLKETAINGITAIKDKVEEVKKDKE